MYVALYEAGENQCHVFLCIQIHNKNDQMNSKNDKSTDTIMVQTSRAI